MPKDQNAAANPPLSEADWEKLAQETFVERKKDVGRVPDRRRAAVPTWYPPGTEPEKKA